MSRQSKYMELFQIYLFNHCVIFHWTWKVLVVNNFLILDMLKLAFHYLDYLRTFVV